MNVHLITEVVITIASMIKDRTNVHVMKDIFSMPKTEPLVQVGLMNIDLQFSIN